MTIAFHITYTCHGHKQEMNVGAHDAEKALGLLRRWLSGKEHEVTAVRNDGLIILEGDKPL